MKYHLKLVIWLLFLHKMLTPSFLNQFLQLTVIFKPIFFYLFLFLEFSITILSNKFFISNNAKKEIYFMDKYQSLTSFSIMLGNLSQLMENNKQSFIFIFLF